MSSLEDDFDMFDPIMHEEEEANEDAEPQPVEAMFKHPLHAEHFILAGKAVFTIRSKKTGNRFTYKVTKAPQNLQFPGDTWFVALLTGPENDSDYTYLGMLKESLFRTTRGSKMSMESKPVKAFCFAWYSIIKGKNQPDLEIWHAGRCGRCGRLLTVPESIERGIGPDCADMM